MPITAINDVPGKQLAPVVLFVYNRLEHTIKTVSALQKNEYAELSDLFVFADGQKGEHDKVEVQSVRDYIKMIQGFRTVNIIERQGNFGLARNIISGVSLIVNERGKIIVLEDDLVTSRYFLKYMNDALEFYENEPQVMQISGYLYPICRDGLPETFFLRSTECWGWATWKDRWVCFDRNPEKLLAEFSVEDIYRFNYEDTAEFWLQVTDNLAGRIYTWGIFWYATVFKMNGLVLYPSNSMTNNIGFDGSGVNCGSNNLFEVYVANEPVEKFSRDIRENTDVNNRLKSFFCNLKQPVSSSFFGKLINKIKSCKINQLC